MRINKYLAQAGVDSRRKVEALILDGKVKVNGKIITDLATDIKDTDIVSVNNKTVRVNNNYIYLKLHKPKGYVTTVSDDKNRKTVMDLLRGVHTRVYPVGRLDYDTEGLLLFTNDGELTKIITRPSFEIEKTYIVHIEGEITKDEIKKISSGVEFKEFTTKPCRVIVLESNDKLTKLSVTITEGKNREIRRLFESINKTIVLLRRVSIGEIHLGGLSRGEYKVLNPKELKYIKSLK